MVSDAIIVAGGLGTRMLPASGSCAKEGLPLVDVPAIRHLLLEAIEAGCDRLHLILSPNKLELGERVSADRATTAHLLEKRPDIHPSLIGPLPAEVSLEIHVQPIANGLGGAIAVALPMIDGPFLVLLGDNLLLDRHVPPDHQWVASSASMHLVEAHQRTGRPVAGIHEVPGSEVSQYGVVALEGEMIRDLVEKPLREEAPSNSVLCGRYLWTKDTAGLLDRFDVRSHGEMQTIEIQRHWMGAEGGYVAVSLDEFQWYDSGSPLPWLMAQVDHALRRKDLEGQFRAWLHERLES